MVISPSPTTSARTAYSPSGTPKCRRHSKGAASSALIRGVLDFARTQGLKVKTLCPFAKAYVDRHPEYADLRQPG